MSTKLEHRYKPRGGCKEVMEAQQDEVLVSGPAGTGKSRACLEKIHMMCLLTPGLRAGIFRKTLSSLGSTALVTWRNYVIKEALEAGDVSYYGGSQQEAPQYRYSNGSTVTIGGMNHPDRIMSSEYDIIYVQEATELTITDLEAITTRLRNWAVSFQQLLMDCNPAGDKHWLKLRCNEGKTKLIISRHEDNPMLFDDDGVLTDKGTVYIGKLDNLTGVRKQRLRYGRWVSAEGVIYEEFDPEIHVLPWDYDENDKKLPLPEEWSRYWVIDFGLVHPFVCKWYAEDEDGNLYVYRELYMTQRTIATHAKQIMEQVTETRVHEWYDHMAREWRSREETVWTEPMPIAIICDHDAQARRTFEEATGLGTTPAIKFVHEGINLVKQRWKDERLFYMDDCLIERDEDLATALKPVSSYEEITSYCWRKTLDGKTKDEPVKEDDHGMDTDRYMVAYKDFHGVPRASIVG